MTKVRCKFTKSGSAVYCSHLDLIRYFRRLFNRAGVAVKYTNGFNKHPDIVFAMPLTLGFHSQCELLEFEVENVQNLLEKLNSNASLGIEIVEVYESVEKFSKIENASFEILFEDILKEGSMEKVQLENILQKIDEFLQKDEILILKKTKRGEQMVNIRPQIMEMTAHDDDDSLKITAITHQNSRSNLNPQLLVSAFLKHGEFVETNYKVTRMNFLNKEGEIFK